MKVSIVTTCKGRLHHLMQTVPLMCMQKGIEEADLEVIVVDYGDPDRCTEHLGKALADVTFVKVLDNTDCFSPSRARNIGGRIASGDVIGFVDGDIKLHEAWATVCSHNINGGTGLVLPEGKHSEITGTCMIKADLYRTIRGYAEDLPDWGYQDYDLYHRAAAAGALIGFYPQQLVEAIPNTEEERFGFYADRRQMYTGNRNKQISKRRAEVNPDGYGVAQVEIIKNGQPPKNLTLKQS
jgi:glycosyltransferase involved in cell wall biosynthesis